MIRQIGFELFKMSRRPRSYVGFVAFLLINSLMLAAVSQGGGGASEAANAGGGALQVEGSPMNGTFMAWFMLGSPIAGMMLIMFLPMFSALSLGEIFAGEHGDGTLRALLTRPVSRGSVYWSKLAASFAYVAALVGFMVASAYALGFAFYGSGGLLTFSGDGPGGSLTWYSQAEALTRIALSYGLTVLAVLTVGMVALFVSVWLSNSLGAIGGAMMLLFATLAMGETSYFAAVKPYLFGAQVGVGTRAFADPIPWHDIGLSALCLACWSAALLVGALVIFRRKDVLA